MATIVKTPSGSWKAVVRKTGWPQVIKTFRTKRDAEDWARRVEDEMVRGVYIDRAPSERITLAQALDRYLAEITPTKAKGTQRCERTSAAMLKSHLGGYSLAALASDIIARYRDGRRATISERTGRSITPATVRLELALLGHLYTIAIKEWGLGLVYNPVRNVRRPSAGEGRDRRLSWSETRGLLKAVNSHSNPMLGWITRIALFTAMRQGEILGLRCRQVDVARRVVRLSDTKNDTARTVPLSRRAARVFEQALGNPCRPKDNDLIFPGEPGRDGKRRPYVINKLWAAACIKAGIQELHFHDLRHEAVSRLVEMGLSDQEVAAISGHKTMQMLRRYTHLRAEDLVEKLEVVRKRGSH